MIQWICRRVQAKNLELDTIYVPAVQMIYITQDGKTLSLNGVKDGSGKRAIMTFPRTWESASTTLQSSSSDTTR